LHNVFLYFLEKPIIIIKRSIVDTFMQNDLTSFLKRKTMEPEVNSSGDESSNGHELPAAFSKRVKINTERSSSSDSRLPTISEDDNDTVKDLIKKYPWLEYCGQTKSYKCKSCSE
jgi:hypothetical protein